MNRKSWKAFAAAREHFRKIVGFLQRELPELQSIQQELIDRRTGPAYRVENPIVYNEALDRINPGDEIRLILVADNPGRREQAAENRYYLAGPSGKLAEKFFRNQPSLGIDFRKNVIILNKTPIHTPRTAELRDLGRLGGAHIAAAIAGSQLAMAELLVEFHAALAPIPVWIIGYSEMRRGGIFETFTGAMRELYDPPDLKRPQRRPRRRAGSGVLNPPVNKEPRAKLEASLPVSGDEFSGASANRRFGGVWIRPFNQPRVMKDQLFLYRHFSMNQFTIDLHRQTAAGEEIKKALDRIGRAYREQILTGLSNHASSSSCNDV
jgi:hypothetical protein